MNLFTQEIYNRFRACNGAASPCPTATMVRIVVELTIEWMQENPEGITEYLNFSHNHAERLHS